jgi:light-regulated signal transduction histidine kinase (bacteriophytochrome)
MVNGAPEPGRFGERLEQVLTNLLDNAVKYSPQGGPVEVVLARVGADTVELSVRDRGLGIPAEKREQLFERFYQAHANGNGHRSGMGPGLFVSRQIAQLHGGDIRPEFPLEGARASSCACPSRWMRQSPPAPLPGPWACDDLLAGQAAPTGVGLVPRA